MMAPGEVGTGADKGSKPEKGYLSSAVDSLNPWASSSRSSTPTPRDPQAGPVSAAQGDHSTTHLYGQSIRSYPRDCPPLNVLWFHATDTPKRKPAHKTARVEDKPLPPPVPKKFAPFSQPDSSSIENAYQKLLEEAEKRHGKRQSAFYPPSSGTLDEAPTSTVRGDTTNYSTGTGKTSSRVPVNEDYLFDVDIEKRELEPVFWLGPVYEVRRGTWFYQEGSSLRPCDENLASQLEEGFLKVRPWLYPVSTKLEDSKQPNPTLEIPPDSTRDGGAADAKSSAGQSDRPTTTSGAPAAQPSPHQPQSHRLFGTYMNSIATYQDAGTAWLSSDSMLSWVTSTVYQRFAGGGYLSGIKLVRGWSAVPAKNAEAKDTTEKQTPKPSDVPFLQQDARQQRMLKRRSAPPATGTERPGYPFSRAEEEQNQKPELPGFIANPGTDSFASEDEAFREQAEEEIRNDYSGQSGESQGREIEHLVLVTHGIGQLLSMRMESLNFVHDVNIMRKTMKSTYANSADLCALNSGASDAPQNCRVQVLPVCWRHLLDFPKKREKRNERDLGDLAAEEDDYPSLEDITIEGVTFARSLVSDLALDVLLYQSAYRGLISEIVLTEANRIYHLFMERNPNFKGKVHVIGHSLGSAIMFDILCREREERESVEPRKNPLRFWPSPTPPAQSKEHKELRFDFDVEDLYCLGSPVGLFQMLKGRTISARHLPNAAPSQSPFDTDLADDPFASAANVHLSPITGLPFSVSSPKVVQLYNIFHPSDPISYRLEPLISSTMSSLKPQVLPYTKKGIFGNVAPQGLSGIGTRVGQSVSGLWTSLSAGIANNILNRSLGLSSDDVARMTNTTASGQVPGLDAATDDQDALLTASQLGERTNERKKQLADPSNHGGRASLSGNEVTLIDDELETLFSKFQETRAGMTDEGDRKAGADWLEQEPKAQKVRREELKVRALNRNGRVDYSIQESVLDFNPINTIASHMAYWADEDVNHFILSQLLSSRSRSPRK